jgi:hypothetical protein
MAMRFGLVVTSRNISILDRFLISLNKSDLGSNEVCLIVVNQTNSKCHFNVTNKNIEIHEIISRPVSLSLARNIGLRMLSDVDILGFPDDDCWYSDTILSDISRYFSDQSISALCVNVFDPLLGQYYGSRPSVIKKINSVNIYTLPISVGIFVKFSDFKNIKFNEDFGVGAKYGSGEETLYLIDGGVLNKHFIYDGTLLVFHEVESEVDIDYLKIKTYSYGFGAMIRESFKLNSLGALVSISTLLVRSTGACFLFLLKGDKSKALLYFYRSVYTFKGFLFK